MGVIRKQSIYSAILVYIGFAIGAFNILVLFPKFLTPEQFGLTRLVIDLGLLFSTLCVMGATFVQTKFFPFYKSYLPKEKNDLTAITLIMSIIGCVLVLSVISFLKPEIIRKFGARSPLFVEYFYLIYPTTIALTFILLFESYAISLKRTVIVTISKEILFRVVTTVLIIAYVLKIIGVKSFFNLYACVYIPAVLLMLIYLVRKGNLRFHFTVSSVTQRMYKRMLSFGIFIFMGNLLNVLSRTSDIIIISSQAGLKQTAVFVIATYLVTMIELPQRGLVAITTPFISEAWKDKDIKRILSLYQKTSLNLLLVGLAIAGCIFLNLDNCIRYFGPTYQLIKPICIIIGVAKLIDLGTGMNSQILLLSKYWKVDFTTNVVFVFLAIPLNYILIKHYGVIGSAYANFIALGFFNLIRFIYIFVLFKLQPFTKETLYLIAIAIASILAIHFIPFMVNVYIDAVIRAILYLILFIPLITIVRISEDVNTLIFGAITKVKAFFL